MPVDVLVMTGWRAYLWAAFLATFNGRPVTRKTLEELTGMPKTTQRRFEEETGVAREQNYIVGKIPYDDVRARGLQEIRKLYVFPWRDKETEEAVEARQLPNSYYPPGHIESGSFVTGVRDLIPQLWVGSNYQQEI